MMEVMTSLTLNNALNRPGKKPQIAPPTMDIRTQTYHGALITSAKNRAAMAPMVYWPGAPMLNRPTLKAIATERPVMISGVER